MAAMIEASKAVAAGRENPVPDVVIRLEKPIPEYVNPETTVLHFEKDAAALAAALTKTLPGGTLDALTARLLIARASRLRVRA